jgi:hypothetical protein
MKKVRCLIVIVVIILLNFLGCSPKKGKTPQTPPPPTNIRLGDIVPVRPPAATKPMQTVEFEFCILEIPQRNIDRLAIDVWPALYTKPVQPNDHEAFIANSLKVGFGERQMWPTIAEMLESAGTILERKTRLYLDFGQIDEFVIDRIHTKTNLFYLQPNLEIKSLLLDRGQLVLKVKTSPVPAVRGLNQLQATTVFMPIKRTEEKNSTEKQDITIESLGFSVNMSPGDFFILGPQPDYAVVLQDEITEANSAGEKSIANFLFAEPEKSKMRIFVVFCTGISD